MKRTNLAVLLLCCALYLSCSKHKAEAPEDKNEVIVPETENPNLATIRSGLTDKNATEETAALFFNLKKIAKTNVLFGHQDDTKRGVTSVAAQWANEQQFAGVLTTQSDVKAVTGSYPAVYGFDFIHIANFSAGAWYDYERAIAKTLTIEAYNRGGVITYCWHYFNPVNQGAFYFADNPVQAVSQVLPGGAANETYKTSLKTIADYAKSLIGADGKLVPVIFRPFHEMDGSWFWWGAGHASTADYIALYKYTVSYLRDELQVRNFLYAWSPDRNFASEAQYLNYYPGDAYVDLVGTDNYEDMKAGVATTVATGKYRIVSDYAKTHNKVAALTETGQQNLTKSDWYTQQLLKSLKNQNIEFAYALVWANTTGAFWTPYEGHPAENDFINFKNDGYVLFSDKMPQVYKLK
ncbi:glycoside hydrolase family 26 protein [Pedobacter metabolipauper]|uniref:Mannan endo-1,4-beta-mannosidase n=1 Tax=Pedobacter metabolipauper TaxID=425513 RepID=A0A4R6SP81_9SPHI|nr:glycosyl hydrolase [Pedobacter metabolipauper]TDQ06343.1 mannan endo-1,4-beta-mannosidase [Pedobacter metabolipauper]